MGYDTLGNRGSATHRVSVGSGGGGGLGGGGGGDDGQTCYATFCKSDSGADSRRTIDGTTIISNTNGKDGLQTYDEETGELRTIKNPKQNPKIKRGNNAEWRIEGGLSSLDEDAFKSENDESEESTDSGNPRSAVSTGDSPSSIVRNTVENVLSSVTDGGDSSDGGSSSDDGSGDDDSGDRGWTDGEGDGGGGPPGGLLGF